jgi:hypothetical protein
MIPLETILALLEELRDESIAGVENASEGTAFIFGQINGQLRAYGMVRERLNELIENANRSEVE